MASIKRSYDNEQSAREAESESENKHSKQKKQKVSSKKVWSEDQEISIMERAVKFSTEKGLDPAVHKTQFFVFIRESQSFDGDFSKSQVAKKLKSLKKKFDKGKAISNPHGNRLYKLSSNVWGSKDPTCADEISIISKKLGLGQNVVNEVIKQKGEAKKAEFWKQWMEVEELELELILKRAELAIFEKQFVIDGSKSSKPSL